MMQHLSQILADAPAQAPEALPPGTVAGSAVVATAALIGYLWYIKKHKGAQVVHLVAAFTCGTILAGSVFGLIAKQAAGSVGNALTTTLTNVAPASTK
jgi:hypothetical protein